MRATGLKAASCAWRLGVVLLILWSGGCATRRAFDEGNELLAQGKTVEGLARLQEAAQSEPKNVTYRVSYLNARDQATQLLLQSAAAQLARGQYDAAESQYRQVLQLDASHSLALSGIAHVGSLRRRDALLADARAALPANPPIAAAKLRELLVEHPAYTPARDLLLDLERQQAAASPELALSEAYRKPISIEFKDTPLKTVFEVIARSSGMNFLFDKDVRTDTKTSIYLKNSTIENAVRLLLLTNQLEQRIVDANTVLMYPNTPAKQKDYQPLSVRSFYLANAEAKNVANTLKSILKTRDVVVDEKLNLLIMRDTPTAIRLAEKLVALHDVAEPEVMLEVEILEINRSRLLDLGVRWPSDATLSPLAGTSGSTVTLEDLRHLDGSSTGVTIAPAKLSANQQNSDANLLANPRIRARNREQASVLIGERVPNITTTATSTGFISESVTYIDVGLKLEVEPTIYPDGEVAISVALEVSSIVNQVQTKSGSLAYQIGTRTASTVLRLKDGENQVLAGLINDEDRKTASGVPLLSQVPLLGKLFGTHGTDKSKTEIVLSITPRIVRNMQRPPAAAVEFDTGTETSLRSGGDSGTVVASASGSSQSSAGSTSQPRATPESKDRPDKSNDDGRRGGTSMNGVGGPVLDQPGSNPGGVASAQLRWQGPDTLAVGDAFALQLLMQSDQPIVSIPLAVGFDTRLLQLTSVTEGEFLKQGGAQTSFSSRIDANGQAIATATRDGDSGATALGSVVTLNFRVIAAAEAETRVQLLAISPVGAGGASVNAPLPLPHVITLSP